MLSLNSIVNWLMLAPVALISLSFHEVSHGLVAYWLGDNTAKREGRLTLNPKKHMDLLGFIMLMVCQFGWAKPVPVNPYYFKNAKRGMAITALAGPVSNIILAFICAIILNKMGGFSLRLNSLSLSPYNLLIIFFLKLFIVNCGLAMFNLVPLPPLDGSKILGMFLSDNYYYKLMQYEAYGMIILIILLSFGTFNGILNNLVYGLMEFILNTIKLLRL